GCASGTTPLCAAGRTTAPTRCTGSAARSTAPPTPAGSISSGSRSRASNSTTATSPRPRAKRCAPSCTAASSTARKTSTSSPLRSNEMRLDLLMLPDQPAAQLAEQARLAEGCGFDAVWVADERFYREVYAVLTRLALAATRVRLGPCVTDPFSRHPALT